MNWCLPFGGGSRFFRLSAEERSFLWPTILISGVITANQASRNLLLLQRMKPAANRPPSLRKNRLPHSSSLPIRPRSISSRPRIPHLLPLIRPLCRTHRGRRTYPADKARPFSPRNRTAPTTGFHSSGNIYRHRLPSPGIRSSRTPIRRAGSNRPPMGSSRIIRPASLVTPRIRRGDIRRTIRRPLLLRRETVSASLRWSLVSFRSCCSVFHF